MVRDPAERMVSAFLNKCVDDGYKMYVVYGRRRISPLLLPSVRSVNLRLVVVKITNGVFKFPNYTI